MEESYRNESGEINSMIEFLIYLYHENMLIQKNETFCIEKILFETVLKSYSMDKSFVFNADVVKNPKFSMKDYNLILEDDDDDAFIKINLQRLVEYEKLFLSILDKNQLVQTLKKRIITDEDLSKVNFHSSNEYLEFMTCVLSNITSSDLELNKNSCNICFLNFPCDETYQKHLEIHNAISKFEWIENNNAISSADPRFEIYYQYSSDSCIMKFTIISLCPGIRLDSVITVKAKSIQILTGNAELGENESYSFFVYKREFNKSEEHPIYVIFYILNNTNEKLERFVELHLIRPKISIPIKPKLNTSMISELRTKKGMIKDHFPRDELKELFYDNENDFNELNLFNINDNFRKYCEEGKILCMTNYCDILTFLVEIEEIEIQKTYRHLTQTESTVRCTTSHGKSEYSIRLNYNSNEELFHTLVNCGDEIVLINQSNRTDNNSTKQKKFYGQISNIYSGTIYFELHTKHKLNTNNLYDIVFRPNRKTFNNQYSALNSVDEYSLLCSYIFPEVKIITPPAILDLNFFNHNVKINPEQKEAVINIVNGTNFIPYIIVGPPGTGKTTTIVESIMQICINDIEARILVTTGSNAASDEVATRLIKAKHSLFESDAESYNKIKILRLYAKSVEKSFDHIDKNLIDSSNMMYGYHFYPSLENLKNYNVIICTIAVTGRLKSAGLDDYFFSHCFIDECGALTEPEAIVAIQAVFNYKINIIIAGDPQQLGPVLYSSHAAEYGLNCSLLERLLLRNFYQVNSDKSYNRRIQTRLIRNFRSHPDLLSISNKLFYSDDLLPFASKDLTHWAVNWINLPNKNIPLIFHCVNGYTKKDNSSTSLFNYEEVDLVMNYTKRLMYYGINGRKVKEEDIGIISPYKKQNIIIKEELEKRNWFQIATGSVEIFQGQEKPIIIISTVRSVFSDKTGVGFLMNEKRLNVMLSRAQALMIVIGSAECLSSNSTLKKIVECFREKNGFIENKGETMDFA